MRQPLFCLPSAVQQLELVAHAPDGFKIPFFRDPLKLLPQALDVNINRSGVAEVIKAPDLIEELISRKHPIG